MRILVIDDHPLIREGLSSLLAQLDPHVDVVDAIST
jgi:DNA-binding NarL/FixJ family response regulator